MTRRDQKLFLLAKENIPIKEIAQRLDISEALIFKKLKELEDNNINLSNNIIFLRNIDNYFVDKDELDEIIKMIFDGYMLIEIAYIKNIDVEKINKILKNLNISSSPYYNPNLFIKLKNKLAKTMKLDDNTLFKRLVYLESNGVNLNDYPKFSLIKRYFKLKRCLLMLEDFLNDNYLNLKELLRKHNLSTGCLAPIIRGEDDIKLLDNYVDPITKQQILLKYEQRRQKVEHQPFSINSNQDEDRDKIYKVMDNSLFWILFMIHFRLPVYELANILDIKNVKKLYDVLFDKVKDINSKYLNAFGYIQQNIISSSKLSESKIFYNKFLLMKKIDKDKAIKMLDVLKDKDYFNLVNSKKSIKNMSIEERLIIANYWVKYALPIHKLPYLNSDLNEYIRPLKYDEIANIEDYNKETLNIIRRNLKKNK